ncbi:hypothetical protein [Spirosoma harenae]
MTIPFQLQAFLLIVVSAIAVFLLFRKITFGWKCPACGDRSPDRIPRPMIVRHLLGFLPLQRFQCEVCRYRFYQVVVESSPNKSSQPIRVLLLQKLTFYLFPFLCLNALAFLVVFIWMFSTGQFLLSVLAFMLLLSTDLLILIVNQAMMRDELKIASDSTQPFEQVQSANT